MSVKTLVICLVISILFSGMVEAQSDMQSSGNRPIIKDSYHYSTVFAGNRDYRIFLPPDYEKNSNKRYPVIYFFHGWAQRYFGSWADGYSDYDMGDENNGDNIEKFVKENDVIIIKVDGRNQFSIDELNITPWNVSSVMTFRQFPSYFKELVNYIDTHYRTISDREHRAVSGLSMGGFMTFWLAAKFPDMISAAGSFCGSSEFMAGPVEFPVRYAHAEMYDNLKAVHVRLNNGTRDRLRFYHRDQNRYMGNVLPQYQYHVYDASHITCGMGDMFSYILDAFENPLPIPDQWDYIDIYPFFDVWGYKVETSRNQAGFTILEDVNKEGFKFSVRNFLPDGELMPNISAKVVSAPIYQPYQQYYITDIDIINDVKKNYVTNANEHGELTIETNGSLHQIGIAESTETPILCMSGFAIDNMPWAVTGKVLSLSIGILNKGFSSAKDISVELSPLSEGLEIHVDKGKLKHLTSLSKSELKSKFKVTNTKEGVDIAKLQVKINDGEGNSWQEEFEIRFKDPVEEIPDFKIADGVKMTVVKAAVDSVTEVVGSGNGDGIPNPGENIVILVEEEGKYIRTHAQTLNSNINPNQTHIRPYDPWQEYDHIGGAAKYSSPLISSNTPQGEKIHFYTEYWIPGDTSGEHITKKGSVSIVVKGSDKTAPQVEWLQVLTNDRIEARVYDGSSVEKVEVTLVPNKEKSTMRYIKWESRPETFTVELVDTGKNGDKVAGDGVYSIRLEDSPSYFYDLDITTADKYDNQMTLRWPGTIYLKNTQRP
ncbi:MAG: hypothetical protein KI791_12035 [Cyclobacteriaceae bacterium]|nr:hypothetical protein [Cyclobacteriaceae bacterium SS2]